MNTLFLIDIIMWIFLVGVVFILFFLIGEAIAERLPYTNKFKIWWRKHILSDDDLDSQ